MPGLRPFPLLWKDELATATFARTLAAQAALDDAFISLHGDLGAGKTTLVRYLLQSLGILGRIKSPTYTIVETYMAAGFAVSHFDFYRFNDPQEWEDAGFRDIFASPGLKLAEWPEKAAGLLPVADLEIHIDAVGDSQRLVHLYAHSPRGNRLLQALEQAAESAESADPSGKDAA
ncbi:MAG: tRNA (adenosine(37)-N6)-threonylcarbamoyltransferase complex ATPase subunit type 1 TsaE [Rhodoferax sp.]|nr:tRNA (adenosine(37)-N6)-threonylcarbamoyltransferase complex ATPase subunit type 1 TsaE [Rhodoferax sp.]